MTKLEGVNTILRRAGLQPVRALDTDGGSNASEAERCLDEFELRIQTRGWNYNTRTEVELSPDALGNIAVPVGVISINPSGSGNPSFETGLQFGPLGGATQSITTKGEILYDLANNTEVFTASVFVSYIQRWEFHCIPPSMQDFIVMEAALIFNDKRGHEKHRFSIERDIYRTRVEALRANNNQSLLNVMATVDVARFTGQIMGRFTP